MENKIQVLATKEDVTKVEVKLTKWIFTLWIMLVLMILGLYLKP